MIRLNHWLIIIVTLFVVSDIDSTARAQESRWPFGFWMGPAKNPQDHCCWQTDDYCRKPMPGVPCANTSCYANCYERKPEPCIPCTTGCVTADDYIRKCYPRDPGRCVPPGLPRNVYSGRW